MSKEINLTSGNQDMFFGDIRDYAFKYLFDLDDIKELHLKVATYDKDIDNYVRDYVYDETNWSIVADYTDTPIDGIIKYDKHQTFEQKILAMESKINKILGDVQQGVEYDVLVIDSLYTISIYEEVVCKILEKLSLKQVVLFCTDTGMAFGLGNSTIDTCLIEKYVIDLDEPFKSSYDF